HRAAGRAVGQAARGGAAADPGHGGIQLRAVEGGAVGDGVGVGPADGLVGLVDGQDAGGEGGEVVVGGVEGALADADGVAAVPHVAVLAGVGADVGRAADHAAV